MMRRSRVPMLGVIVLLAAASQACGKIVWVSLEDRVAGSDAVVVGEITKIDPKVSLESAPGLTPCTIKVGRVLKGPADVKEVILLWRMPPKGPDGRFMILSKPSPPVYRVGQKQVWQLKRIAAGPDVYVDAHYHFKEPADRADEIAAIVAAAKDPRKVLTDEKAASRLRLSAGYFLLREACTEDKLPRKPAADEGKAGDAGPADTSGHDRVDAALVEAAVARAVEHFADTATDGNRIAEAILRKVGCPTDDLRPAGPAQRGGAVVTKPDEVAAHRKAWAEAIATWWQDSRDTVRLWTPKETADAAKIDPRLAERAQVVLRVRRLRCLGADRLAFQMVKVLEVLKNAGGQNPGPEIIVLHRSTLPGVPDGVSTVYLVPFPDPINQKFGLRQWLLLGGGAAEGVSHCEPAKPPRPPST